MRELVFVYLRSFLGFNTATRDFDLGGLGFFSEVIKRERGHDQADH